MVTEDEVNRMFGEGFDCSQIVLAEVSEALGMKREEALKVAASFGVGFYIGGLCGAASGALMALGLKYGNHKTNDMAAKLEMVAKREEFLKRFKDMNGSMNCPDLLGVKITSFEELVAGRDSALYRNCPLYCVNAVKILEGML